MSVALKRKGIVTETVYRAEQDPAFPVKILPAHYLSRLYQELGESLTTTTHIPQLSLLQWNMVSNVG